MFSRSSLATLVFLIGALGVAARADDGGKTQLSYALEPGQTWRSTQTILRVTRMGADSQEDRGVAEFVYRIGSAPEQDRLTLDASFASHTTSAGASPLDFSAIRFRAVIDRRGRVIAQAYEVGDAEPPPIEGVEPDPVAFRQMLRSVAAAWVDAVFWLPELPNRALAVGESFVLDHAEDLGDLEPGVTMKLVSTHTYELREVLDGNAHFSVEVASRVESSTAQSSLDSTRRSNGEAVFDLALGMWSRHETRSTDTATFTGADGLSDSPDEVSATTTTTISMERLSGS